MGLAILFTKPIFQELYKIANPSEDREVKTMTQHTINAIQVFSEVTPKLDTLQKTVETHFYLGGTLNTTTKKETLFANSEAKPKDYKADIKKSVTIGVYYKFYMIFYLTLLVLLVTMVYAPIAAFLVDLFPTKIRYTSLSLPYHIGNGVFGGLVPLFATILFEYSKTDDKPFGDPLSGLDYPMTIAFVCLIIGTFFLPRNSKEREKIGGNREYQF